VGFPYHLNSNNEKIPNQIVDITDNFLLDELGTVDYFILV